MSTIVPPASPTQVEDDANPWVSLEPTAHCFREDNCIWHVNHDGPNCCCCGYPADAHEGCDCD